MSAMRRISILPRRKGNLLNLLIVQWRAGRTPRR